MPSFQLPPGTYDFAKIAEGRDAQKPLKEILESALIPDARKKEQIDDLISRGVITIKPGSKKPDTQKES